MTFEVILDFMKNLLFLNLSILRNFDLNWFINERAKNKKAKILEFGNYVISERRIFLRDKEELMFLIKLAKIYFLKKFIGNKLARCTFHFYHIP